MEQHKPTEEFAYKHDVYVGVADKEDICQLLLQAVFPGQKLTEGERERLDGNGWIARFQVNENGCANPDSYVPASFIHGAATLRRTGGLSDVQASINRAMGEFAQRRIRLHVTDENTEEETAIEEPPAPLTWEDLSEEFEVACKLLGEKAQKATLDWRVVVRSHRFKREKADSQDTNDYLNSFYLDDLDLLIERASGKEPSFGKALKTYLGEPIEEGARIDILQNHEVMSELVSPARLPSARWPTNSKHPLVLAQQAVVAHVLHSLDKKDGIIGVNGPPGTGKTTLLCDVIAQIITNRAERIAHLDKPVDLFEETTRIAEKNFFPIKSAIMGGSSIVVASNNNNAVENITQELPARKKVDEEYGEVDYFSVVIEHVFDKQGVKDENKQPIEGWGVVAAALGNSINRFSFCQGFFREDQFLNKAEKHNNDEQEDTDENKSEPPELPPTIKQLLEEAVGCSSEYRAKWEKVKRDFLMLLSEFRKIRTILVKADKAAYRISQSTKERVFIQKELKTVVENYESLSLELNAINERSNHHQEMIDRQIFSINQIDESHPLSLWDRLLALFGRETHRAAERREKKTAPLRKWNQHCEAKDELKKQFENTRKQQRRVKARIKELEDKINQIRSNSTADHKAWDDGKNLGAKHLPNDEFWSLLAPDQHRASIAVYPDLDNLRSRIFLQAMELHRLSILCNAGKFLGNLRGSTNMLTGKSINLSEDERKKLWDAFFFVVPVVSTTLASFRRLFAGMGQNSLGWLLLDEAGQATPQSAAGAIWRCRRAVIIGDPKQVEPIFTVPFNLVEKLRKQRNVLPHWSPETQSVQTLADRITRFGSWIVDSNSSKPSDDEERMWTGMPLRTHRRCIDPMFSVSNCIAYAEQMVQGQVDKAGRILSTNFDCILGDSKWFDVRSNKVTHPVSEDEIKFLLSCIKRLIDEPAIIKMPADRPPKEATIYVISPFRKIAQALKGKLNRKIEYGTVHTFQGKEADIVFLILGTAPDKIRARQWAAKTPNLLNVAITRAKSRLYVIGDVSLWADMDYFRVLLQALPREPVCHLQAGSQETEDCCDDVELSFPPERLPPFLNRSETEGGSK
jgi:hypothetical protein